MVPRAYTVAGRGSVLLRTCHLESTLRIIHKHVLQWITSPVMGLLLFHFGAKMEYDQHALMYRA